ncbi:MAG: NADH-quinone oxidoreductase subunit NuoF [Thermodesulfovibrionales bacterium]|nr:NADH-quinone oxidoreductase subunit NuoF [Thermodesulfovibrionales bacterium]
MAGISKILVCGGTSGISAGAREVIRIFEDELGKRGLLDQWKVIRVGDKGLFRDVLIDIDAPDGTKITYQYVKPSDVLKIVEEHIVKGKVVRKFLAGKDYEKFFKNQIRIVLANCGEISPDNIDDYLERGGYSSLKKALETDPLQIIDEIQRAGLRGRGGGGFNTGLKWRLCREVDSDERYVICNADEGDPGAFMDRSVLEGDPHSVLEGMAIAAYAIGSKEGYIYCRAEYPEAIKRLQKAITIARERGFLGKSVMNSDFSFDVQIVKGAGAFVCGEETALIASIEGKRGMPRMRPPYPAQKGLWGKPTIINNVETFANIRHIIKNGADWYASMGTATSKGTKVFALAGKVKNTGLIEIPMGTTINEIIYGPGGGPLRKKVPLKAVQMGGPSGGCLPVSLFDTPVDYEEMSKTGAIIGSGGMIVMDQKTCMVDIAKFFLQFTVLESCGKCLPCRVGLKRMLEVLSEITDGKGTEKHLEFLIEMGETVKSTSLCGLGNTAPNPVLTTIKYFKDEYYNHIFQKQCPAGVCTNLLKFKVIEERCIKCGKCYKICPSGAIQWKKGDYAKINNDLCIKCKACVNLCDDMAIN